jgi:hypothetical protein
MNKIKIRSARAGISAVRPVDRASWQTVAVAARCPSGVTAGHAFCGASSLQLADSWPTWGDDRPPNSQPVDQRLEHVEGREPGTGEHRAELPRTILALLTKDR